MNSIRICSRAFVAGYAALAVNAAGYAAELPVPCVAGACGSAVATWVTDGAATAVQQGNLLTIQQQSQNAILNWQSFNISADGTVEFQQPDATSVALNRIYQQDPSRIFGALNANGRVYLVNRNGLIFGEGARVNVAALVASTLDVSDSVVRNGLVAGGQDNPAFLRFVDETGQQLESQPLQVQQGARLFADGGQIFLFAPVVENSGRIETPDGQTILAAGQSVYLSQSAAGSDLRGIVVAVDLGGTVTNGLRSEQDAAVAPENLIGQILAERGNVTLAGLAVNQFGRVSATTSVRANGSVRLIAAQRGTTGGGELTLGQNSRTEVQLDDDSTTKTVDVNEQPRSSILLAGQRVVLEPRANVSAPGGDIRIKASNEGAASVEDDPIGFDDPQSRIYIADDAVLDVSGADVTLPMDRNVISVELRGSQLADSPDQRNGALRGQRVQVDIRQRGVREDGSTWVGSPLADLTGDISTVSRTVAERHLAGGTIDLTSSGDIIVASRAHLDVSGGSARYQDGFIITSAVLGADGRIHDIASADPNNDYVGVVQGSSYVREHSRWGVTERFDGTFGGGQGRYEAGYVEGKDAGSLSLLSRNVIFDGRLTANRVIGPHQRLASTSLPAGSLYRPFDQIPVGGEFLVGRATGSAALFIASDITMARGLVLPELRNPDGSAFDPVSDLLPVAVNAIRVRPEILGEGAATRALLRSDGAVTVPEDIQLSLPAFSSLTVTGRTIDFGGDYSSPSGSINLQSRRTTSGQDFTDEALRVRGSAHLDVSGAWINETAAVRNGRALEPLAITGGSISAVGVESHVVLEAGSVLDVSGGARMTDSAGVRAGAGGVISLGAVTSGNFADAPSDLQLDSELRGYALNRGGVLNVAAGQMCVGATADSCGSLTAADALWVRPEQLRAGGFSSYSLASNRSGLIVAGDSDVLLQASNLILAEAAQRTPSLRSLRDITTIGVLDPAQRQPVNLTLSADHLQPTPLAAEDFPNNSLLSIQRGARIQAEPGARIQLESNTSLHIDGLIAAPAGEISAAVNNDLLLADNFSGYAPQQSLWLGDQAHLSVGGAARYLPNQLGLLEGDVLAGGSITLRTQRGYIATTPGSVLDVSGAAAPLDIRQAGITGVDSFERRTVASRGGQLNLAAAEGIFLNSEVRARGGSEEMLGGSLLYALDARDRYGGNTGAPALFPEPARRIELVADAAPVVLGPGASLPEDQSGRATLSAQMIVDAAFDHVRIEPRSRLDSSLSEIHGEFVLAAGVDLNLRGSLSIDASIIRSEGGAARLAAPVISLGQRSTLLQGTPSVLSEGDGRATFAAEFIDLVGHSVMQGFSSVELRSANDLRARGVQLGSGRTLEGSLRTSGVLDLYASQVYPSTLSRFSFVAETPESGAIRITSTGASPATPYSAGGQLTFRAPTITQAGTVRAPFGVLAFEAERLELTAASVTATSGAGLITPFGQTQGGFDWVYQLGNQTLVFADALALPAQSIRLDAESVDLRDGASVDVRGGGDMVATEFIPGVTGTRDVLSASVRPDAFVILPETALSVAPHDVAMYDASSIAAGDAIYLAGGDGVPAGRYVILPARYAFLPGAYYVRPVEGHRDIGASESSLLPDGSRLISGYRTFAGTGLRVDDRTSGFSVRPGSEVLREAQYVATSADEFFTARAADAEASPPRLPRDSGTLAITATRTLTLSGDLLGQPAANGRGTELDISSDALRVVAGPGAAPEVGVVDIDAGALSRFGAESILLGGARSLSSEGLSVSTRARTIEIAPDAVVTAPELLLVASESILARSGSELRAEGAASVDSPDSVLLEGQGALLRVSTGQYIGIERRNSAGGAASLLLDSGSLLSAPGGVVTLESAGTAAFGSSLDLAGGALALIGDRISIGDTAGVTDGLTLSNTQLATLALDSLVLSSRSTIDLHGPIDLRTGDMSLRGRALRGFGGGTAQLSANSTLDVAGLATSDAYELATGSGSLILSARDVELDAGYLAFSGFSQADVVAERDITLRGRGQIDASSDLAFTAQRLTADSGATRGIAVEGAFVYEPQSGGQAMSSSDDLGARVEIDAASLLFGGRADLHSGILDLTARTGDLIVAGTADLRLNGLTTTFDSLPIGSRGGSLRLDSRERNVSIASGARIDVASASAAMMDHGDVSIRAERGVADLQGSFVGAGAAFSLDAGQIVDFARLSRELTAGEFTAARSVRLRGPGDLVVGAGAAESIEARSVEMSADQGRIVVDGTVRSNASGGGRIVLSARDGLQINGTLDASAANATQRNGRIELRSDGGPIFVAANARVAALDPMGVNHSLADGTLHIRAPRTQLLSLTDADPSNDGLVLAGDLTRLGAVTVEGFARYADLDGAITADETAAAPGALMYDDATGFMQQADAMIAGLGIVRGPAAEILPGIEITSDGNLELQSDWSLHEWRFNGLPGYLTLRAAGDLSFAASLSDGFTADNPLLLTETGPSWSYRLVAGADVGADPLAVRSTLMPGQVGSLRIAAGTLPSRPTQSPGFRSIRTGTGSIEIAAAGNLELGNAASTIYTAGRMTDGVSYPGRGAAIAELGGRMYPDRGGDIRIHAGGDIIGAPTTQLVTDWLWRVGVFNDNPASSLSPAWTVNFSRFLQNVGALGGGDVHIQAGGNIMDLSVSSASIGRQAGGRTLPESRLEIIAGGSVNVRAARNIDGGVFYAGRGEVNVYAGDAIGRSALTNLAPVLALGDSQARLSSRTDLQLSAVVNPTLVGRGSSQTNTNSYFATYTPESSVSLTSASGDATLLNSSAAELRTQFTTIVQVIGEQAALSLYPPDAMVSSLRGDVVVANSFSLFPAVRGGLNLLAGGNVRIESEGGVQIIVSDGDPAYLPSLALPRVNTDRVEQVFYSARQAHPTDPQAFHAPIPERLRAPRMDFEPSRLVAIQGDVMMTGSFPGMYFAEPVRVSAARDVLGLSLIAQNLEARDVSSITAGRDVRYALDRADNGGINPNLSEIAIDGPGTLQLRAGRNLDLQTSAGISSRGNLQSPALPADGADISVQVGMGDRAPDYAAFLEKYLAGDEFAEEFSASSEQYREDLVAYMRIHGYAAGDFEGALAAFRELENSAQAPLLERMFFSELRASGRSAAQAGETNGDFTRGFAALTTLFPGANPDLEAGETNPYVGNVGLYFSRIYTLDGGDIRLLSPGGEINVGLASPPAAFNLNKGASDLGVVAQRSGSVSALSFYDFLVNESRVFAADGGDILVWATQGDIDAGRGAKTAISAPPPTITFDPQTGAPLIEFPPALTGSGIQTLASSEGREPGNVDLFAPRGVVNAGDAGIVAGNLTIAATAVLGADNIQVSGVAVGVPVDTGGLGASLAGVSAVASSASSAAVSTVAPTQDESQEDQSLASAALSWLDVFVVGLGEETCDPKDTECLKRQSPN